MPNSDEEGDECDYRHDERRNLSEESHEKGSAHHYFNDRENLDVVCGRAEAERLKESGNALVLLSKLAAPEHDDEDGKGDPQEGRSEEAKG